MLDGEDQHYLNMETAILWGYSPFEFMDRPEMERAIMVTHHRERGLRTAMVSKVQNDVSEKKSKRGNSGGDLAGDAHADFFGPH